MRRARGFNLIELLIALTLGLTLIAAFLAVLGRARRDFAANESLARLQDSARHALGVLSADVEHAGFFGFASASGLRLVRGATVLAESAELRQPVAGNGVAAAQGLPAGAHACGVNFAVDLMQPVQGADNHYALGADAQDCAPTASAGGASDSADTLTLRHASLDTTAPRAGRLQVYSAALSSRASLLLFADGQAPGPLDDQHEVRDLEVRTYYISQDSVSRPGWPALRVKALTESRGAAQFRDEEVLPGVEDLQVEYAVAGLEDGEWRMRLVAGDSPRLFTHTLFAVRLWLRLRADLTEDGFHDDRPLDYANVSWQPGPSEARHRRLLVSRVISLRNAPPARAPP